MMQCWAGFAADGGPGFAPVRADGLPMMVFDRESYVIGSEG